MESTDCERQAAKDKNSRNWSNISTKSNIADFMNFSFLVLWCVRKIAKIDC